MKIVFIYPDLVTPMINFCPAVSILSAVLKKAGHETSLIHLHPTYGVRYYKDVIINRLNWEKPDLIGITATSFNYSYANEIAGWIKEEFSQIPVILGGSHATIQSDDCIKSNFDIFVAGEGENAILEILDINKFDHKSIVNGEPIKNLDDLPFQDFDILDTPKILGLRNGWFSISFSRGCPFACTYCANQRREPTRYRSPHKVVDELEYLVHEYDIKMFNFDDDNLPMNREWMNEFMELYLDHIYQRHEIGYAMNFRANFLTDDLAQHLFKSGCKEARIGVETGNEELRRIILNKGIRNIDIVEAFDACRKWRIKTTAFMMMGLPGENIETFQDTIDLIATIKPNLIRMTFLSPYKNTAIYDYCLENKLFKKIHPTDEFSSSPLKFEHLTDLQIYNFRHLFPWYVNLQLINKPFHREICRSTINEYQTIPRHTIDQIARRDNHIDWWLSLHKHTHYRYFPKNLYYFELVEHDNN